MMAVVSPLPHAVRLVGLLALLVVTLVPPAGACCSGVTDCHRTAKDTRSCCERAEEDALAMKCCQGGEDFARNPSSSALQTQPPSASVAVTVPVLADGEPGLEPEPPPSSHSGHLYTLHSTLLI